MNSYPFQNFKEKLTTILKICSPKKNSLNEAQRSFTNLFSFLEQSSSFNEELLKNFNFIQNKIEEQKYFSKSQTKLDNFFSKI